MISSLSWDTDFFGVKVGTVYVDVQMDLTALNAQLLSADYDVVYVCINDPTDERLQWAKQVATLYDIKLTYRKKLQSHGVRSELDNAISYRGELSGPLMDLALMSGAYSRFYLDPKFKPHFERLYKAWLEGSLEGTLADQVFVSMNQSRISGFVTVYQKSNSCGQIGLLAVHPDYRGSGIARALIGKAEEWVFSQGCNEIIVVTQGDNVPACRFYEKSGYLEQSRVAIFHFWKNEEIL